MSHQLQRFILTLFKFLAILSVIKAHVHIVKLIALALFGLGGLVLYQAVASGSPLSHISTAAGRRSLSDWPKIGRLNSSPSLANALQMDEKECARLYICEIASASLRSKSDDKLMPNHLRARNEEDELALIEFKAAAEYGKEHRSSMKCRQKYKKCPFKSIKQMEAVINQYKNL